LRIGEKKVWAQRSRRVEMRRGLAVVALVGAERLGFGECGEDPEGMNGIAFGSGADSDRAA